MSIQRTLRKTRPLVDRFWSKAELRPSGCLEWTGSVSNVGYGMFSVLGGVSTAHRMAWKISRGPVPRGLWVLHHCDNRICVRPDHLFLGTRQDNVDDMVAKGRSARGERAGMAKVTEQQVRAIRAAYAAGLGTQRQIARQFGLTQQGVCRIVNGQRWKHLPDEAAHV